MKTILATILSAAFAGAAFAQVPSLINYQGRLTDANGDPVTGSKNFAISIYDAATGGNLLYTEDIGAVTLDDNGVYSFQFGSAGTSDSQVTETIGTTDDSTLTYTKTLANTPIVENSITVTDGTNSWSQSVGNPGVGATATLSTVSGFVVGATITNGGSGYTSAPALTITGNGSGATATATLTGGVVSEITINSAGSGYSGGATITIAPPVIPFRVDYSGGAITATYSTASAAGRTITATYRYGTSGITGALSSGAEHWMAVSVDSVVQGTRQRVLAVPFAMNALYSDRAGFATHATFAESAAPRSGVRFPLTLFNFPTLFIRKSPVAGAAGGFGGGGSRTYDVPKSVVAIERASCAVENLKSISGRAGYTNAPTVNSGFVTIELVARSGNGLLSSIAKQTINGSLTGTTGDLVMNGPIVLDQSIYDYYIYVQMDVITTNGALVVESDTNVGDASNFSLTFTTY